MQPAMGEFCKNFSRALLAATLASLLLAGLVSCGGGGHSNGSNPPSPVPTRTWRMGFSSIPPRIDTAAVIQGIDLWSQRAELAAIHEELPWTDLLAGMSPDAILDRDKVQLVNYLRGKGLHLYFMADLTDGLSRGEEAPQLRALGRSLTEPAVQQVYRDYVLAVARKLNPEIIGLAAETNLIRAAAPPALYQAVVRAANDAAADLRAAGAGASLMASVQVEVAWGVLGGTGTYAGVETDFTDFPFVQILGLSSYPYFSFTQPEDIPANYYSRLLNGRTFPVMVVEGGWTSASVGTVSSSPELQARYITRHAQLLDAVSARGVIQLLFADLDLSTYPPPIPPNLPLFTSLGLTDSTFAAKPALAAWDALFARRLVQ
ncbi:MAG TPA: hypothetical protein VKB41_09565 [Steroidobacteraceae bacterium]|nr:hypothetical protein [Steroidobacteraceae bacterium]